MEKEYYESKLKFHIHCVGFIKANNLEDVLQKEISKKMFDFRHHITQLIEHLSIGSLKYPLLQNKYYYENEYLNLFKIISHLNAKIEESITKKLYAVSLSGSISSFLLKEKIANLNLYSQILDNRSLKKTIEAIYKDELDVDGYYNEYKFQKLEKEFSYSEHFMLSGNSCSICGMDEWCGTNGCPFDPDR